jgi:gliding motility-associated protein GldE
LDPDSVNLILLTTENIGISTQIILGILIFILLFFTALISGSEVALFSLSSKDINYMKQKEDAHYQTVLGLIERPKRLLATILIANNFLSIAVIISTDLLFNSLINMQALFPNHEPQFYTLLNILIQVVLVTFFLVLFGEVLPKVYATQNNIRLSVFTAPAIKFLDNFLSPLSNFLVNSTSFIERKIGSSKKNEISNEDFENAIELTVGHSATNEEKNIYKGIVKFGEIYVKQIMRARMDVSALNYQWGFAQVKAYIIETGFSRLPVYQESLDEIKGILYTKDILAHIDDDNADWHQLIRAPHFIHETKLIKPLLKEFQQKRNHMAIVVDEFGGTSGIVTLEDIVEEIIGEIKDEFDEDDLLAKKIDDYNYLFEGKTLINDVCRILAIPVDVFESIRGESDSLAGLVLEIAGKFPAQNETVHFENFGFTVVQLEKRRIQKIKLTINPTEIVED